MNNKKIAKVIRDLLRACDEVMAEGISKTRSADWELVNDALVTGNRTAQELDPIARDR